MSADNNALRHISLLLQECASSICITLRIYAQVTYHAICGYRYIYEHSHQYVRCRLSVAEDKTKWKCGGETKKRNVLATCHGVKIRILVHGKMHEQREPRELLRLLAVYTQYIKYKVPTYVFCISAFEFQRNFMLN